MTEEITFEARLEERLRARAALASRPFDAAAIARQAIGADGRRRRIGRLVSPPTRPALRILVGALLLAIALLGAVAGIGALFPERFIPLPPVVSNGWIVVSANPRDVGSGEAGDIYLLRQGAAPRRIIGTDGDGVAQACPRFSPDGGRLAYGEGRASPQPGDDPLRGRASVAERAVVIVGLNDQGDASPAIIRVALSAGPGEMSCPEWSPDGRHLAVRVGDELWVVDAASGEATRLPVVEAPWGQQWFEWSRDGTRVAVAEPRQIRVLRVDDGSSTTIPVAGAVPASMGWTAADQQIVYLSTDEPGDGRAVNVVDVDGANGSQLVPDPTDPVDPQVQINIADAVVSPDGVRVAYAYHVIRCTSEGCAGDPERLTTMDLDGSNVVELTIPPDFFLSGLQWSPDGRRLLLGSIAGVVSVAAEPGSPAIVHSNNQLNLEWSGSELTWQPVIK